jgi:O-antigen/teichoic acid export membrane protein
MNKTISIFVEFVLAITGAIVLSVAFSALTLIVLSGFEVTVEFGRTLVYSVLTLMCLPIFGTYFRRHERMGVLESRTVVYAITFLVPMLFAFDRYFEGALLLSVLISAHLAKRECGYERS